MVELSKLLNSYWVRSGFISLMTRVFGMGFGFINFFIIARILEKNEFGIWVIFLSILKFSESIRTAFIYNPLLRYLNSEKDEEKNRKKILDASLTLNLSLAVIVSLIFLVLAGTINYFFDAPEIGPMLIGSIVSVFAFSFLIHINFSEQASFKFVGSALSSTFPRVFLFLFLGSSFITGNSVTLTNLVIFFNIGYVIAVLFALSYSSNRKELILSNIEKEWIWRLFHYGKFTFGTNMSSMLNKSSKSWFLGGLIGNAAVAIFAPALRILTLLDLPLIALAKVFYPKIISMTKDHGEGKARSMYEKSVGILFFALLPFVAILFIFAEQVIWLLVGPDYNESIPILQILVVCGLFEPFNKQFGVTLNAIGKAHINFYFVIVSSFVGVIISLIGIVYFGIIGAAYGTVLTSILSFITIQFVLAQQIGVNTLNVFRSGFETILLGIRILNRPVGERLKKKYF